MSRITGWRSLLVFFALVALAASMGSLFPPGDWYESLDRPAWTPPNLAFPVVWTLLYIMIAVAGWRLWRSGRTEPPGYREHARRDRRCALTAWGVQLLLNAAWTPVVFGAHALGPGLIVIILLWGAIVASILAAARTDRPAAWLLVPYGLWVSYAMALNAALWGANP